MHESGISARYSCTGATGPLYRSPKDPLSTINSLNKVVEATLTITMDEEAVILDLFGDTVNIPRLGLRLDITNGKAEVEDMIEYGTFIATPNLTISCPTLEIVAARPPITMYVDKSNNGLNLTLMNELHPAILVISPVTSSKDLALQMNQAMKICEKRCWYTQITDLVICEASNLTNINQDQDTFEEISTGAHLFLQRNLRNLLNLLTN